MNFKLHLVCFSILIFYGCLGPFKKKPTPQVDKVEQIVIAPEIFGLGENHSGDIEQRSNYKFNWESRLH